MEKILNIKKRQPPLQLFLGYKHLTAAYIKKIYRSFISVYNCSCKGFIFYPQSIIKQKIKTLYLTEPLFSRVTQKLEIELYPKQ